VTLLTTVKKSKHPKNPERSKKDLFLMFEERIRVFRTASQVWQMQVWITEEQKYVRESLKTTDKEVAAKKAEERYIELRSKVQHGQRVFSIRASELRDQYLEYIKKQVESDQLSIGRANNIKTFTKHYIDFVGSTSQIENIPEKKFKEYLSFRRDKKNDIQATVVINESITIKQMYKWAQKEGILRKSYECDFGTIKKPNDESVRESYTTEEFNQLITVSKNWYKKKDVSDDEDRYYRRLIHDFIIIMSNGGFRTQEARLLKWKDIKRIYGTGEETYAEIEIRAENTKIRKSRSFEMRRGDVFKRIKTYSRYTEPDDFVFAVYEKKIDKRTGKVKSVKEGMDKTHLYDYYGDLVNEVGEKYKSFDSGKTLYCLRHFWITIRILAGMNIYDIAKISGTSLTQIQKHYDAASSLVTSQKMNKNKIKFDRNGMVILEREFEKI
jgi:integrase